MVMMNEQKRSNDVLVSSSTGIPRHSRSPIRISCLVTHGSSGTRTTSILRVRNRNWRRCRSNQRFRLESTCPTRSQKDNPKKSKERMTTSMERVISSAILLVTTFIYAAVDKIGDHVPEDITVGYILFVVGMWIALHIYMRSRV